MSDQLGLFDENQKTAPPITLRDYQRAAVDAVYSYLRTRDDNPCVVIPTGGGKTPVMATICGDAATHWGGRVLILAHVKELLSQAADKIKRMCRGVSFGVYSAGLNRRDMRASVTVAGIQSVYEKACDFDPFDLVLVDEAHLIAPEGDGMYRQFLADAKVVNPRLRVVGFTATPFRMKSGLICTPDGFLNSICYEIGVRELIAEGFLSPLVSKRGVQASFDTSAINVRAGEFVASETEAIYDVPEKVKAACKELVEYTANRKSVLIFGCGIQHCEHVKAELGTHGLSCGFVCGDTPTKERDRLLAEFTSGSLKYLVNVNVLTTGFDASNIDCVVLLRPTASPGLYYQMVGRGFRLHEGKADCLVLDFGGNVKRHGPVDRLEATKPRAKSEGGDAAAKECPECHELIACGYAVCPQCGYEFPQPERAKHETTASNEGVLSGEVIVTTHEVRDTFYSVHVKKNASSDAPRTVRVDYMVDDSLWPKSEWICFEHTPGSFPQKKAATWWRMRSPDPVPLSCDAAIDAIDGGALAETLGITVRRVTGDKFERVIDYVLGSKPEPMEFGAPRRLTLPVGADEDIPF